MLFAFLSAIGALTTKLEQAALFTTPLEEPSGWATACHIASIEVPVANMVSIGEFYLVNTSNLEPSTGGDAAKTPVGVEPDQRK